MSKRERAIQLLETIPDYKVDYVIAYMLGMTAGEPEPNTDTIEAFQELEDGGGHTFQGSAEELITQLMED